MRAAVPGAECLALKHVALKRRGFTDGVLKAAQWLVLRPA
jgi:dihydrodipicolinate reductase